MKKDWTIVTVNYQTSNFLKWQLKSAYEFNDPSKFNFLIIDNSWKDSKESESLANIVQPYKQQFKNIKVIPFTPSPTSVSGSAQHGEAMTYGINKHTESEYIWAVDPDHLPLRQNLLGLLQEKMEMPHIVAVGSPYAVKVGIGHSNFPCFFGAAHRFEDIKGIDLRPNDSAEAREESKILYPESQGYRYFSYDMGYRVREKLSTADNNENFIAFEQTAVPELNDIVSQYSFQTDNDTTRLYYLDNKPVGFHLSKGSFTGAETEDYADPQMVKNRLWLQAQDNCCEMFYNVLCNDGKLPASLKVYQAYRQ
jgi:hypothetical protein